ncbi:hypothetical protein Zmor_009705 [Zophobas morio]|uniref:Uncharacterized protein n=1 Tax=Zophobas morio TaxID=2755281 RepID=A0AA38IR32_9CUCU|nr:hypothetical protein Zmor_009705 [Zophobas morio]
MSTAHTWRHLEDVLHTRPHVCRPSAAAVLVRIHPTIRVIIVDRAENMCSLYLHDVTDEHFYSSTKSRHVNNSYYGLHYHKIVSDLPKPGVRRSADCLS